MTFKEFAKRYEELKEATYLKSWYILAECLNGKKVSREQVEVAKYVINRKDGMPTQPVGGDDKKPILINIVKDDGNDNQTIQSAMGSV